MLRILALVPYKVYPAVMGGQKGIALFYKYLSQYASLSVYTTRKNRVQDTTPEVMNTISNSKWRYVNPFIYFTMNKLAREKNVSHLLFEHPYYAWLIVLFSFNKSFKIIVHSHNIESERFRSVGKWWWKILWYYERVAYRKADFVWFKTQEDRFYAIKEYNILRDKTWVVPYGVEQDSLPTADDIQHSKTTICNIHGIESTSKLLLFNGTLSYKPNMDALEHILRDINPLLLKKLSISYKIIVCGKGLSNEYDELNQFRKDHIIYAGFVEDIDLYFRACDLFLNPLLDGGGIKTKLVEALGFGKAVVSTQNGAIGVDEKYCSGRLRIVGDYDWDQFANEIKQLLEQDIVNPHDEFYHQFAWKNIAENTYRALISKQ